VKMNGSGGEGQVPPGTRGHPSVANGSTTVPGSFNGSGKGGLQRKALVAAASAPKKICKIQFGTMTPAVSPH
jgi:hypothetical protein